MKKFYVQYGIGKAKLEWQKKQEANLEYVAYTRSMYGLYFVM